MTIINNVLTNFPQTNKIVKSGKEKLMSGELDLTDLDSASVSVVCYIGKQKTNLSQELEGNIETFSSYFMAKTDVNPTIETHDLLVTELGEVFIVGAISQRNNNTTINTSVNDAAYLRGDLEIYE